MLPLVTALPARAVGSGVFRSINRGCRFFWPSRHLCQQMAQPVLDDAAKNVVLGPLTMLSDEEEMMRETGTI